jgi:uncharacterized membrane protein
MSRLGADPASNLSDLGIGQRRGWQVARLAWIALLVLCVAWELWLAPIRPGGSWLVLKALPLLLPLRGVWRGDVQSMQWALLLVLAYLMEGAVRAFEPAPYSTLAWIELLLVSAFFTAAIVYVRPFKRAAKARAGGQP